MIQVDELSFFVFEWVQETIERRDQDLGYLLLI